MPWVCFQYDETLTALKNFVKAKALPQTALTRNEIGTQNTIFLMRFVTIAVFKNDSQEAKKRVRLQKIRHQILTWKKI